MVEIAAETRFMPVGGFETVEVHDGFIIYDEANEKVHYLNATAAIVYSLCDGEKPVSDVEAFIRSAYELNEDYPLRQFFVDLEKAGLVCRAE